jgi:RNA-binding protein
VNNALHDTLRGALPRAPPVFIRFSFMPPFKKSRSKKDVSTHRTAPRGSGRPSSRVAREARQEPVREEKLPRRVAPKREENQVARPLSASQKRYLRGLAHDLKAVVLIGQKGVTAALLSEFDVALAHHELVKVKLADDDREARAASVEAIRAHAGAEVVQTIGKVACFYKRNPDRAQFTLPK